MVKTILIIEDDDFLLGMEAKKLTEKGYNILTAMNGNDASKIINDPSRVIDLVLLDILLPEMDGFNILKMIRENPIHGKVPVVIFSNLYEEKDVKQANMLGVTDFLIKSNFTLDELVEKITTLLK